MHSHVTFFLRNGVAVNFPVDGYFTLDQFLLGCGSSNHRAFMLAERQEIVDKHVDGVSFMQHSIPTRVIQAVGVNGIMVMLDHGRRPDPYQT